MAAHALSRKGSPLFEMLGKCVFLSNTITIDSLVIIIINITVIRLFLKKS